MRQPCPGADSALTSVHPGCPQAHAGQLGTERRTVPPRCALMSCFPTSRVTKAVPFRTMSVMVLQALGDSLSVGEMKLPAALFITT